MYEDVGIHVQACMFICTHIHTYIYTGAVSDVASLYEETRVYTCTCMYIYMYTHTHIHTYIHIGVVHDAALLYKKKNKRAVRVYMYVYLYVHT